MEITFVTSNQHKVQSLRRALEPSGATVTQQDRELFEPQVADIRTIAASKAAAAYAEFGRPILVQDTGFIMDATPGFPGAFVKFVK